MQKTENYKQSEVGLIPEDWEVERLESLTLKIGSGITPTGGSSVYKQEGRPFLRSQNVGWGNLLLDDIVFIDEQTHMTFPSTEIKSGDVFLNITGASIGRSSYASKHVLGGNVNQHVCIIRPQQEKLTSLYLNHFLLSNRGQKQIDSFQSGGNRQGLNFGQIKTFLIPLPPLPEQTAIASALSDMDALIAQTEKLIEKKKAIKQGVMQELLTGKKRLKGFENSKGYKQTEVGLIPEDWECVKLKEIAKLINGRAFRQEELLKSGKYEVLRVGNFFTSNNWYFSNLELLPDFYVEEGDLMYAWSASFGPKFWDGKKCIYHYHIWKVVPSKISDKHFLYHLFDFDKSKLLNQTQGGTMFHLTKNGMEERLFATPSLLEQKAIGDTLTVMDMEIELLGSKLQKLKLQKQGMMQALLTGKIRLI